jgi:predicted aminopeptidase
VIPGRSIAAAVTYPLQSSGRLRAAARRVPLLAVLALYVAVAAGCGTLGYYSHIAGGQLELIVKRRDVDELIESLEPAGDPLRSRLVDSQRMLNFAERHLGLNVGGRYRSYVDVDRPNIVWNLFAAPELSLQARQWCYPIAGCAPYRGYFDETCAERQAARLRADHMETYLGGVAAYSTLGWFDDPLLSTFIDLPEPAFAELLFHELAHSRVWVKGDVAFNESFASFVGDQAMREWLAQAGKTALLESYERRTAFETMVLAALLEVRVRLGEIYASDLAPAEKRRRKALVLAGARECLSEMHSAAYGEKDADRFDAFLARINNAFLASLATYSEGVPFFRDLFRQSGGDWRRFFEAVDGMARLDKSERAAMLERSAGQRLAAGGEHQRAAPGPCRGSPEPSSRW